MASGNRGMTDGVNAPDAGADVRPIHLAILIRLAQGCTERSALRALRGVGRRDTSSPLQDFVMRNVALLHPWLLAGALLVTAARELPAQQAISAKQLYQLGQGARNAFVVVTGGVDRYDGNSGFWLDDDYGTGILVVVSGQRPNRRDRVSASGIVSIDANGNPYIVAQRIIVEKRDGTIPPPETGTDTDTDTDGDGVPDAADRCPATPPMRRSMWSGAKCRSRSGTRPPSSLGWDSLPWASGPPSPCVVRVAVQSRRRDPPRWAQR